jgi:long-chain acyl-CoA synthetase
VDNNGRELPPNQSGEIIVRGPIMKGYYDNPEATARTIKNGWLYTGDVGRMDEDGEVFLTGRSKDIIIVKGQNIYPSDIEEVLYTHPKVAEASVVGVADETRGETVRAIIRLKVGEVATEAEIKHFCREHMADYKVPRQVSFVDSLPKTAAGKIDKKSLSRLG